MAQEDQIQRGSSSGGAGFVVGSSNSGSSSKKLKQRKTPQRGLGVAELERIRLEQQNEDVASPSLPILNHPLSNQSSLSVSFSSVSQVDLSSSNPVTRMPFPAQSVDFRNSVTLPLAKQASYTGFEALRPGITVLGQDGPQRRNSCEYVKRGYDGAEPGLPFQSNIFLPHQFNFPPPIQFTREYQQSSSISVNSASATLSPSMLNFPVEPPSNQSRYHYPPTQSLQEEKIRGVKRPYPFSQDNPSGLWPNYRSPTCIPIRSNTSTLNVKGGSFINLNFRDSSSSTFAQNRMKHYTESSGCRDFLTQATPSAYPVLRHHELPDFESLPFQTRDDIPTFRSERSSQPLHCFFPPADVSDNRDAASKDKDEKEKEKEKEESVDLNLKL